MNKRANRVYWLLILMMLILGFSMAIDGIRAEKHKINEPKTENNIDSTETTTNEYESNSETSTLSSEEAAKKVNSFYSGQVFVGDSIMSGFAKYTQKKEAPQWLNNVIFLSEVSMGISSALNNDSGPLYQGKSQNITTSISEIKPNRIFINLGINEMDGLGSPGYSVEKLIGRYSDLILAVKKASPNSKIYILNITPCTSEKETPTFNNSVIKEFNSALKNGCEQWQVTYLDFAAEFGDSLDAELSNGDAVHHNDKAYREKWIPYLEKLALSES